MNEELEKPIQRRDVIQFLRDRGLPEEVVMQYMNNPQGYFGNKSANDLALTWELDGDKFHWNKVRDIFKRILAK